MSETRSPKTTGILILIFSLITIGSSPTLAQRVTMEFKVGDKTMALFDIGSELSTLTEESRKTFKDLPADEKINLIPTLIDFARLEPYSRRKKANEVLAIFKAELQLPLRDDADLIRRFVNLLLDYDNGRIDSHLLYYFIKDQLVHRAKPQNYLVFDAAFPFLLEVIRKSSGPAGKRAASILTEANVFLNDEQVNAVAEHFNSGTVVDQDTKLFLTVILTSHNRGSKEFFSFLLTQVDSKYGEVAANAIEGMKTTEFIDCEGISEKFKAIDAEDGRYRLRKSEYEKRVTELKARFGEIKQNAEKVSYNDEEINSEISARFHEVAFTRASLLRTLARCTEDKTEISRKLIETINERPITSEIPVSRRAYTEVVDFGADGSEFSVVPAFEYVGTAAVPPIIEQFGDRSQARTRYILLKALGFIGSSALEGQTGDQVWNLVSGEIFSTETGTDDLLIRRVAVETLGNIGSVRPGLAISVLSEVHSSRRMDADSVASAALVKIAGKLQDTENTEFISQLEAARDGLKNNDKLEVKEAVESLSRTIVYLKSSWWKQKIWNPMVDNILWLVPPLLILVFFIICIILYWLRPIYLFRINQKLVELPAGVRIPIGVLVTPIRYILVVGFFYYSTRVLDSWIAEYLQNIEAIFFNRQTVKEREVHIPIPVKLDKIVLSKMRSEDLRPYFKEPITYLVISGDGGSGKTSHAFSIAKLGLEADEDRRLLKHVIFPVIVEQGDKLLSANSDNALEQIAREQIRRYTMEVKPLAPELVRKLMEKKRVLLIVDGYSEMPVADNNNIQEKIVKDLSGLPAAVVVFTTRRKAELDNLVPINLEPMKIGGSDLSNFLESYLLKRGVKDKFRPELFDLCNQLSLLTLDNEVTPLFVKLFADLRMGAEDSDNYELPRNIPELVLYYLNYLNRGFDEEISNRLVHKFAETIAWYCLKKNFTPQTALVSEFITDMGSDYEANEQVIKHLEEKLKLFRREGVEEDEVRFSLDPLAEYLAAIYLINHFGNSNRSWKEFIGSIREDSENLVKKAGFLQSLYECCSTKYAENVPAFLTSDLLGLSSQATSEAP